MKAKNSKNTNTQKKDSSQKETYDENNIKIRNLVIDILKNGDGAIYEGENIVQSKKRREIVRMWMENNLPPTLKKVIGDQEENKDHIVSESSSKLTKSSVDKFATFKQARLTNHPVYIKAFSLLCSNEKIPNDFDSIPKDLGIICRNEKMKIYYGILSKQESEQKFTSILMHKMIQKKLTKKLNGFIMQEYKAKDNAYDFLFGIGDALEFCIPTLVVEIVKKGSSGRYKAKHNQLSAYAMEALSMTDHANPCVLGLIWKLDEKGNTHGMELYAFSSFGFINENGELERKLENIHLKSIQVDNFEDEIEYEYNFKKLFYVISCINKYIKNFKDSFFLWKNCGNNILISPDPSQAQLPQELQQKRVYKYYHKNSQRKPELNKKMLEMNFGVDVDLMEDENKTMSILSYEYIEGKHVAQKVSQFLSIAKKLQSLHKDKIIHGDIKEDNLIFCDDPEKSGSIDGDISGTIKDLYPNDMNLNIKYGMRHPKLKDSPDVSTINLNYIHDWFSFAFICKNYSCQDDDDGFWKMSYNLFITDNDQAIEYQKISYVSDSASKMIEYLEKIKDKVLVKINSAEDQKSDRHGTGSLPKMPISEEILKEFLQANNKKPKKNNIETRVLVECILYLNYYFNAKIRVYHPDKPSKCRLKQDLMKDLRIYYGYEKAQDKPIKEKASNKRKEDPKNDNTSHKKNKNNPKDDKTSKKNDK
eukprot:TRINITY_DN5430_c0_g1_i2.p1 TRINITY_DN5430_c0_g1~~TRINITY_DN5430_c0_g1_i2.p1  ORF type:complete len:703 (+),score=157.69 TRINITY_DN5430_c0_g1_i2:142-2250(+)